MLDRRHFLIGAGALLTASFVNRAKAFSRRSGEPLVLSPAQKARGDPLCLPAGDMERLRRGMARVARA